MTNEDTAATSPPPVQPAGDAAATPTDLFTSLDVTRPELVDALRVGLAAYAVAWLGALVATVLLVGLTLLEGGGDDVSYWWLLTAPGQLVAMAFRSPAVLSVSESENDFAMASGLSTTAPVLTILAVALAAGFWLSRRDEAAASGRSTRATVTLAATTAGAFVAVAWLVSLVLKVSISGGGDTTSFGAARVQLIVFGLIAMTIVAALGRRPWAAWPLAAVVPEAARGAWRAGLVQLAVFSVLVVPALIIWLVVEDAAGVVLALPVVLGNVLVYAVTVGHFGAVQVSGAGSLMGGSASGPENLWIFSDGSNGFVWVLAPFALVGVLAAAVVLHERGKGRPRTAADWVWAALVYALLGGALTFLGSLSSGIGSSLGADTASFGPAPWFLLVLAVWGAAAELIARVLGPPLAAALPAAWVVRAAGPTGQVAGVVSSVSAPAETAAPAGTDLPVPLDPRTRKILIGACALVVVGIVAAVGVSVVNSMWFGPEKRVQEYFDALGAGDADRAVSLAELDYSTDERALLTSAVLGAGSSRIEDVEIGDVDTQGDWAVVTVEYTIDGAEKSQDVTLKSAGSRFVVFDDWKLADVELGGVYVTAAGAVGLTVNGHELDIAGLDDGVSLPAFPGTYEIVPTAPSSYLEYEDGTATIGTDEEMLDFEAKASGALLTQVTRQANALLESCIAKKEAEPDGCPIQTYDYGLEDVRWVLDEAPTYAVEPDYDGGWRFSTVTAGRASVTAKEPSFFDDEPAEDYTDTVAVDFGGTVLIQGGQVTVQVDDHF